MKRVQEDVWLSTTQAYEKANPERGRALVEFTVQLADEMEGVLSQVPKDERVNDVQFRAILEGCLRKIDPIHLSGEEIIEAFVLLTQFWEYQERFWTSLQYLELRLVQINIATKLHAYQQQAQGL